MSAVISLVFVIGCLPALRWVETKGRRPVIVWSFAAMLVPFALLGFFPSAPIWFVIICLCLYGLFSGGPTVLEWTYPNELFPTEVRASAVGVALTLLGWLVCLFWAPETMGRNLSDTSAAVTRS